MREKSGIAHFLWFPVDGSDVFLGEKLLSGNHEREPTSASFRRRSAGNSRKQGHNPRSCVIFSPEGTSRTASRQKPPCRRHFLAGRPVSYGFPSGTPVPASISRRKANLIRNPVRNPCSGVIFSPKGLSSRQRRTPPRSGVISTPERRSTATLTAPSTRPARQSLSPGAPLPTARPR